MIRHLVIEIRPYPHLAAAMGQDDDRHRILAVSVTTETEKYGFSEILEVDQWDSIFDHIMQYATRRLKEMIKNDRKKITPSG